MSRSDRSPLTDHPIPVVDIVLDRVPISWPVFAEVTRRAFVIGWFDGQVVGTAMERLVRGELRPERRHAITDWAAWQRWQVAHEPPTLPQAITSGRTSIVICTRDRTDDLGRCLKSIERHARDALEVIVVDSCPSDDRTRQLVEACPSVRYLHEPRPGAALARNRGIHAARGDAIAFTDDDAMVEAGWLDALLRPFVDPTVVIVTGLGLPLEMATPSQEWFERFSSFVKGFERREFEASSTPPLAAGNAGASVNMALRTSMLPVLGVFDESLGPGTPARAGEDHELFYRAMRLGFRLVYEPAAVVRHKHRTDWVALQRAAESYGIAVNAWFTHAVVHHRDHQAIGVALRWFWQNDVRGSVRSIMRRPDALPIGIALRGLKGALQGPYAYFKSRRVTHAQGARRAGDTEYRPESQAIEP